MKNEFNEKLLALRLLTEEIEKQGFDVAPLYADYMRIAFCIANDCGESGREYFHRICKIDKKYNERDADKLFTSAVNKGRKGNGLATLFELAKVAGIDVEGINSRVKEEIGKRNSDASDAVDAVDAGIFFDKDGMVKCDDPMNPLPTFLKYDWPWPLNKTGAAADCDAQRDAMLLSALVVLGATLGSQVRFLYDKKYWYSSIQSFLVAPPSAGKSVVNFNKLLAMPIHDELRARYESDLEAYLLKVEAQRGKKGDDSKDLLIPPLNKVFLIPADNTGIGILQNIIDSGGYGLLFESEAETLSKSIDNDNGHFADLLRKLFDHEYLAFNRRTNHEFREIKSCYVGIMLCGTPDQVKKLVPSVENGLFSRILFYYFNAETVWRSQFGDACFDANVYYKELGLEWKKELEKIKSEGTFTMVLTREQQDRFNATFSRLLKLSQGLSDDEANSFVRRLGVNLQRLMSIVALLRSREGKDKNLVRRSVTANRDGMGSCKYWDLSINDSDFQAVLSMADVFFSHALHVVSFLQSNNNVRRMNSEQETFYNRLPDEFNWDDVRDLSKELGLNYNTVKSWVNRWKRKRSFIVEDVHKGCYLKVQPQKECASSASSASVALVGPQSA